jgi:hypothetical protein
MGLFGLCPQTTLGGSRKKIAKKIIPKVETKRKYYQKLASQFFDTGFGRL